MFICTVADEGMGWRINLKHNASLQYSLSLRYVFASIRGRVGDNFPSPGPGCRELLTFSCLNLFKCPWDILVPAKLQQLIHNHLSMFPKTVWLHKLPELGCPREPRQEQTPAQAFPGQEWVVGCTLKTASITLTHLLIFLPLFERKGKWGAWPQIGPASSFIHQLSYPRLEMWGSQLWAIYFGDIPD